MDKATVIGLGAAALFIVLGITNNFMDIGAIGTFINIPSIMITVGGTIASVMAAYSMKQIKSMMKVVKNAFKDTEISTTNIISRLVSFAEKARREGLLALEDDLEKLEDEFLKDGIQMVIDGTDPEIIRTILETEITYIDERHKSGRSMMDMSATMAPAFGMIGTLIGLINMLKGLDDPDALGPGMAVALITTLYGSIMANVVFTPLSNKLKIKSEEELLYKQMMLEGLLSIQAGDNPRVVEEKLKAYLEPDNSVSSQSAQDDDDD
ncbi:MAG: motility protein A [Candidatus Wallbacteria bacterium HGW-Wallbacteria-1]|uniref:Motility protein A n=1 Tax=Candidatus Wallbacteria bacterium HGW-Wallbacteria-1 TaxID=2013854 RepID=A0A2N1PSR0_9BACT|nr:MAG: motility protein A [Candidatus Wallbacteria bacterium HGW-Wallbacteria-1]